MVAFFKPPLLKQSVYFLKNTHLHLPCCFTSVQKPCPGESASSHACLLHLCAPGTQNLVRPIPGAQQISAELVNECVSRVTQLVSDQSVLLTQVCLTPKSMLF